ncbi:MAG TPA: Sir2 family NAD-dependent protein deacetylase [Myxococcota bacterium]|jgi:NAD-dependent SIR2 family protein deacetylase
MTSTGSSPIDEAARAIAAAEAILVSAGAGMGVDSGLPDFRGDEGFWKAYPPYRKLGLAFEDLANPRWFVDDPARAWGFYGHRLGLYRKTVPHDGFRVLRALPQPKFVFTSNVDGQFQRAGFLPEQVLEVHGAIETMQCLAQCGAALWSAGAPSPPSGVDVVIDEDTMRARDPLPRCPSCGGLARPNILMFGDGGWDDARSNAQSARLQEWLDTHSGALVVIECGAGGAIPTVRRFGEMLVKKRSAVLIRINVREPEGASISLAGPAKATLLAIEAALLRR